MCVHPKTYTKLALQIGALFVGLYVICFFWPTIRGLDAELSALHYKMWQIAFLGFTGFNAASFIAGLAQAFVWGLIAVGLWRLAGICCGTVGHRGGLSPHTEHTEHTEHSGHGGDGKDGCCH